MKLATFPLMYHGASDTLLDPSDPIPLADESYGMGFEGEVAVVTDAVPMGPRAADEAKHGEPPSSMVNRNVMLRLKKPDDDLLRFFKEQDRI